LGAAFVADIFHEVDEEVRKEQLKKLWDRYGVYLIVLAVLVVAGVGAWRGYQYYETKQSTEAGAQFEGAATLAEQGKQDEAEAAFAKLANDAPGGYRALARLRAAAALSEKDPKAAVAAYDAIAADGALDRTLRDTAAIRAGILLVDTAPLDEMRRRLEPQAEPGKTFRHTAREMLALSAWRNDDLAAARRYVDMITIDPETSQGVRQRSEVLNALLGGKSGS
jgi:hypothetical protein